MVRCFYISVIHLSFPYDFKLLVGLALAFNRVTVWTTFLDRNVWINKIC